MTITRETLIAERDFCRDQKQKWAGKEEFAAQLLAHLDKPEPPAPTPTPDANP